MTSAPGINQPGLGSRGHVLIRMVSVLLLIAPTSWYRSGLTIGGNDVLVGDPCHRRDVPSSTRIVGPCGRRSSRPIEPLPSATPRFPSPLRTRFPVPNSSSSTPSAANGRLYVADAANHRIQVFETSGKLLDIWGKEGSDLGELCYPHDISFDSKGNLYITETLEGRRVQRFLYKGLMDVSTN